MLQDHLFQFEFVEFVRNVSLITLPNYTNSKLFSPVFSCFFYRKCMFSKIKYPFCFGVGGTIFTFGESTISF